MAPSLPAHMAISHSNVHTALSDGASSGLMVLAISFPVFLLAILAAVVIIVCRPSSRTASPADEDMSVHHPSTVSFGEDPFSRLPLERRVSTASSMTKRATGMAPLPISSHTHHRRRTDKTTSISGSVISHGTSEPWSIKCRGEDGSMHFRPSQSLHSIGRKNVHHVDLPVIRIFSTSGTITELLSGIAAYNHDSSWTVTRPHVKRQSDSRLTNYRAAKILQDAQPRPTATRSDSSLAKYHV